MLDQERKLFEENLQLTQNYCSRQILNCEKNAASILRSINPVENRQNLFTFKLTDYGFEKGNRYCFSSEWAYDPFENDNSNQFQKIFNLQIQEKKKFQHGKTNSNETNGKILVSAIDESVRDGASEVSSEGLIDIYDMPPIDTWFHITNDYGKRNLYAWIPKEFEFQANEGILVNCVDCIQWVEFDNSNLERSGSDETFDKKTLRTNMFQKLKGIFTNKTDTE